MSTHQPGGSADPHPQIQAIRELLDCPVCFRLLYEPLAINCGHVMCRTCLSRALVLSPNCPICRASCYVDTRGSQPNVLISTLTETLFKAELQSRPAEVALDEAELDLQRLGLFFLNEEQDRVMPGAPVRLQVFEPRYMLLMERCVDNGSCFGLQRNEDSRWGIAVKVESIHPLPGGRLLVEGNATTRYRLTEGARPIPEEGTHGLHYAATEMIADRRADRLPRDDPAWQKVSRSARVALQRILSQQQQITTTTRDEGAGSSSAGSGNGSTDEKACSSLRDALCTALTRVCASLEPRALHRLTLVSGNPPPSSGTASAPERWSYFAAQTLALPAADHQQCMQTTSTLKRLLICYGFIEKVNRKLVSGPNSTNTSSSSNSGEGGGGSSGDTDNGREENEQDNDGLYRKDSVGLDVLDIVGATHILRLFAADPDRQNAAGAEIAGVNSWFRQLLSSRGFQSLLLFMAVGVLLYVAYRDRKGHHGYERYY